MTSSEDDSSSSSNDSKGKKKEKPKKEEEAFVEPQPIEMEIDHTMIAFAKAQGIRDPQLLQGRMSFDVCNILSQAKLKHRTCK